MKERRHPKADRWCTKNVLTEYAGDPIGFIRDVLGVELYDKQIEVALALSKNRRVAVKSGQKCGKSILCICLAIWWVCTRANGKCILTSSSFEQVKDPLWSELQRMHRSLVEKGIDLFPAPGLDPSTGCRWDDGRYIRGFSTNKRERAAGKSGAEQLFILDEASGISSDIAEAFLGNTLGGGKILMTSNPTETSGFFYEAFNEKRGFWQPFTISSRDTPNYLQGREVIRGLATREDVDALVDVYGADSPVVAVRVDGSFPLNLSDAVVGLGLIDMANRAWASVDHKGASLDIGVDVALYGEDNSSVAARRGLAAYTPTWIEQNTGEKVVVNGYDPFKVAGIVVHTIRSMRNPGEPVSVKIDNTGGFGSGVAAKLRELIAQGELEPGIEVFEINVSHGSSDQALYTQLRDELWFNTRTWIQAGGGFARDPELEKDLIAPKYSITPKGQKKVEPKKETKKRLGRSPDRADAMNLALYDPPPTYHKPDWDFLEGLGKAWPKPLEL